MQTFAGESNIFSRYYFLCYFFPAYICIRKTIFKTIA